MRVLRIEGTVGEQAAFEIVSEGRHGVVVGYEGEHVALPLNLFLQQGEDFRIESLQAAQ